MYKKIIFMFLILPCITIIPGCKNKSGPAEANEVKEKVSDAITATDSYLAEQKNVIMKKSQEAYDSAEKETKELISQIKTSSSQNMQKVSSELETKLDTAQQKLQELKEAGQDKLQAAENAFNKAIEELKSTYTKTKDEYEKSNNAG